MVPGVVIPALSVIVVTPDTYDAIRTTVRRLHEQSIAGQLELLIVAPSAERVEIAEDEVAARSATRSSEGACMAHCDRSLAAGRSRGV